MTQRTPIPSAPTPPGDSDTLSAVVAAAPSTGGNFANVVLGLTGVNAIGMVAGLVTGTLTARMLGADGRGELAAILAVLTIGPWLLDLGLSQWLARERALRRPRRDLVGAALPVAVACSLTAVFAAVPLSHALGNGRPVVTAFLQAGLFLMPVLVILNMLMGLAIGESRWILLSVARLTASVGPAIVIATLAVIGQLTVASAAAAYLGAAFLAGLMFLKTIRGVRRVTFDRRRSRDAAAFGSKIWLSTIASVANLRLDQVLMAGLVASSELGRYAVAVTVATVAGALAGSVGGAVFPRVAAGELALAARSCRMTICIVGLVSVVLASLCSTMIPFVFGEDFAAATTMALILLVAGVPMAATTVLGSALSAANAPAAVMRAELVGLAVTVPALVLLLPAYGGIGAAAVSLAAYGIRAIMQLRSARRTFEVPWSTFVVPTPDDWRWFMTHVKRFSSKRRRTNSEGSAPPAQ